MARRSLTSRLVSYGIYGPYDGSTIPDIQQFTDLVPARIGIEFGLVLHVEDGRGEVLDFRIDHPPFADRRGRPAGAFTGQIHIKTQRFDVFLGDTIWEPWQDKIGLWTLSLLHQGTCLVSQAFTMVPPDDPVTTDQ